LADFQKNLALLEGINVRVVAASVDSEEEARKAQEISGITYPLAYGLSAQAIQESHGAFVAKDHQFIHATGFIIRPDGKVSMSVYSSGAIGRLTAEDCHFLIDYFQKV